DAAPVHPTGAALFSQDKGDRMTLFRTVDPAAEPVTLAELKAHLRLEHDSEDALLNGLNRAAREDLERTTGLALIDQNWRLALDKWPRDGCVAVMLHPT